MILNMRWLRYWPVVAALVLNLNFSQAGDAFPCGGDIYSGGNGHDVPTPFENVNRRFELADGEIYDLPGKLFPSLNELPSLSDQLYFAVDMEKYSWIAHAKHSDYRVYPLLSGDANRIRESLQATGSLLCRAHGKIVKGSKGSRYVIYLEPIY